MAEKNPHNAQPEKSQEQQPAWPVDPVWLGLVLDWPTAKEQCRWRFLFVLEKCREMHGPDSEEMKLAEAEMRYAMRWQPAHFDRLVSLREQSTTARIAVTWNSDVEYENKAVVCTVRPTPHQ